jgi:uncharacterized protein (UPF0335 family)
MTADGQIKSFFQRWENLEAEKKQVADLMKDLFIEAKSLGYQPKAMRAAFRLKTKQDLDSPADAEFEAVVDIYLDALNSPARNARLRTREKIEEFDPITGEFRDDDVVLIDRDDEDGNHLTVTVDARVASILNKSAAMPLQSPRKAAEAVSERAATMVDHASGLAEAGVSGQPEMIPALTGQFPGVNVDGAESAGVTGGESAATNSPSDDDAIAAVKGNARLANVTDVEPSSSAPIATASQGEAEAPSVERVSPQAETDTGSAAANTGGDHVTDHQSFAAQAGASVQVAPAKILRPHCRTPKMCGSGTIDHCHSCKVAMREREMA